MRLSTRRQLLTRLSALAAATVAGPLRAKSLSATPSQTEGPYYPVSRPATPSANLRESGGNVAQGVPLTLTGQVMDTAGKPLDGVTVEIWQADHRGIYRHPEAPQQGEEDPHFAGFGASTTDASGGYAFTTIVPVPYTGRPPHIHVKIWRAQEELLTTQLYLDGHADNDKGLLQSLFFRNSDQLMMTLRADGEGKRTTFNLVV